MFMYLYNSLSHKKELFQPNTADVVKITLTATDKYLSETNTKLDTSKILVYAGEGTSGTDR